ncbi:MAG: ParA family protein, partial [Microbacteriaceae bacterium]|nr:ParA family protein [Microbacteriaceae bacterium]
GPSLAPASAPPAAPAAPTAPARIPRIITVWGPAGAPGRSTIAIGLAAELTARGHEVCLVDADTYGGTIAPALGLLDESPAFAAACRLAGAEALTSAELDRVAQSAPAAAGAPFAVLTGIGRPHRWPELSSGRVTTVLEQCRSWREIVVVDAGFSLESDEEVSSDLHAPRRNAATIAALRAADEVVAVGAADPLGLARLLRTHADLLETIETARVRIVINRVRASVLGIDPHRQVRQTLDRFAGIRDAVLIDDDPDAADAALLTARPVPLAAPRSALSRGIAELADALGFTRTPATSAGPRWGRPFWARRRTARAAG